MTKAMNLDDQYAAHRDNAHASKLDDCAFCHVTLLRFWDDDSKVVGVDVVANDFSDSLESQGLTTEDHPFSSYVESVTDDNGHLDELKLTDPATVRLGQDILIPASADPDGEYRRITVDSIHDRPWATTGLPVYRFAAQD